VARRKISTVMDEHLFRRAKLESIRRRKQLSEILGEALERYLANSGSPAATTGAVADTWGLVKLDRRKVDRLVAEAGSFLDA
jgi:hypothetical protein